MYRCVIYGRKGRIDRTDERWKVELECDIFFHKDQLDYAACIVYLVNATKPEHQNLAGKELKEVLRFSGTLD